MERMPPEMWMRIFEDLDKSKDTENAYRTCTFWRDILNPTKSSWMFDLVFPSFLEYLSKGDILKCRSVCKQWRYGVDNFLENNLYYRPTTEDYPGHTEIYKTDFREDKLYKFLSKNELDYNHGWSVASKREKMLQEAKNHSGCPIVGKSISISEQSEEDLSNIALLEVVGRYVWFLKISITMLPSQALKRILKLLSLVPNIKMLQITGTLQLGHENIQELPRFVDDFFSKKNKNAPMPFKIETLRMCLFPVYYNELKECLLRCISPENLYSLHSNFILQFPPVKFKNLADLSLILTDDRVFHRLCHLNSPIRRLSLELLGNVESLTLFATITHFRLTLRNLELTLKPDYYSDRNKSPAETFSERVDCFDDKNILAGMKQLKRITLKECRPPSLNFLLGVSQILEYLHLPLHVYSDFENKVEKMMASLHFDEEIDIMEKVKVYLKGDKIPVTYDSNVWSLFPKLKFLSMYWNKRDVGNSREAYEKIKSCA